MINVPFVEFRGDDRIQFFDYYNQKLSLDEINAFLSSPWKHDPDSAGFVRDISKEDLIKENPKFSTAKIREVKPK